MNAKLAAISSSAAEDLQDFIRQSEEQILEAWTAAEQEAQDNETKPKFKLAYAITLDLDADKMETALSWGVRFKVSHDQAIPDPQQGKLDGIEDATVTLKTSSGKEVTSPLPVFKAAVADLKRQKAAGV